MIKAVIFDCFGVVITDTLEHAYESLGGDFKKDGDKVLAVLESSDKGEIPSHRPVIAQMLGVSESRLATAIESGRVVNKELLEFIEKELKPKYKIAMLSNVGKGRLPDIFGVGFLEHYFEVIVASGDVGYAKPEARAYEIVADRLELRLDECVFIDDRENYLEGARGVGMHTVLYTDLVVLKRELGKVLELNK